MKFNQNQKDAAFFGSAGLLTIIYFSALEISYGQTSAGLVEAWQKGLIQPYIIGGVALILVSYFYSRGHGWSRWLILVWYPVVFGLGALWVEGKEPGGIDLVGDIFLGWLPVSLVWMFGVLATIFKREHAANGT